LLSNLLRDLRVVPVQRVGRTVRDIRRDVVRVRLVAALSYSHKLLGRLAVARDQIFYAVHSTSENTGRSLSSLLSLEVLKACQRGLLVVSFDTELSAIVEAKFKDWH
jgi:hypothetical protein